MCVCITYVLTYGWTILNQAVTGLRGPVYCGAKGTTPPRGTDTAALHRLPPVTPALLQCFCLRDPYPKPSTLELPGNTPTQPNSHAPVHTEHALRQLQQQVRGALH